MVIRGTSLILLCKIVITLASDGDFATVDEDVKAQLQKLREDVVGVQHHNSIVCENHFLSI